MHKTLGSLASILFAVPAFCLQFSPQDALSGNSSQDPAFFTAKEYIGQYLMLSPSLQAENRRLKIAYNNYKNAFTESFLPTFSLSAQASKEYDRENRLSSWEEFRRADSSGRAEGNWNLFNTGKDALAYKSASLDWQTAQINFDQTVQQYVLEAAQIYYDLLLSQKLLNVYEEDLSIAQKQYEQDKLFYENGLKTRSDLLSSETNWRSSQLSVFSAKNDYANALKNFNIALNRPVDSPVQLDEKSHWNFPLCRRWSKILPKRWPTVMTRVSND